jgi:hypothetical protein
MIDLKLLTEVQQAGIYKKLCESILRTYILSQEEPSADTWKGIYEYISKATKASVRKNKNGIRVSINEYCETVTLNTENSFYTDSISRLLGLLDDGTAESDRRIKNVHSFARAMCLKTSSRAGAKKVSQ